MTHYAILDGLHSDDTYLQGKLKPYSIYVYLKKLSLFWESSYWPYNYLFPKISRIGVLQNTQLLNTSTSLVIKRSEH